jgi:hypothetical protein
MLSPTYAVLLLRGDILSCDYRAEALPWIKANTPNSVTFTIKRHMSFWSEPESFNTGFEAFLAKVK